MLKIYVINALILSLTFFLQLQCLTENIVLDWVRSLYVIHPKALMSQYTKLTRNHGTIKFYVRYMGNECFEADTYLLLTASMSNGEHCFDWERSLYGIAVVNRDIPIQAIHLYITKRLSVISRIDVINAL